MLQRKPRHAWSKEDRILLCVYSVRYFHSPRRLVLTLYQKVYQNSIQDVTSILNHFLSDNLQAEGYVSGMPVSTVDMQLAAMRQGQAGYEIWRAIHLDMSIPEVRKRHRDSRDLIEDAGLALGLTLHLRAEEPNLLRPHGNWVGKRRKRNKEMRGLLGDEYSSGDDTQDDMQSPVKKRPISLNVKTNPRITPKTSTSQRQAQLLTPTSGLSGANTPVVGRKKSWTELTGGKAKPFCQNTDEFGRIVPRFPRLLYRWYSRRSQGLNTPGEIRAGKFLDTNQTIPPPEWDLPTVANHLIPEKRPSPYISFRESLTSCVFNALKEDEDAGACVAVIDFQQLKATSQQWGHDAVSPCASLVKKFELKLGGKKRNYKGTGEWLVYGRLKVLVHRLGLTVHRPGRSSCDRYDDKNQRHT
jgi:hypothetical protein